ncbi:MAG: pyridoxamine 5'-phosphate oxidase family protein [bacterium]|nr:pyridoxamine 5'-phosphate oxidase family protein [bacterium]
MDESKEIHDKELSSVVWDEDAINVLERSEVGFLAMTHETWPYCVPVNYVYYDGDIYIHSSTDGKKLNIIEANPPVCFTILGDYEYLRGECTYVYESVIVYGKAWIIKDTDQKRKAYEALVAKYEPDGSLEGDAGCIESSAIIVIEIDDVTAKKRVRAE